LGAGLSFDKGEIARGSGSAEPALQSRGFSTSFSGSCFGLDKDTRAKTNADSVAKAKIRLPTRTMFPLLFPALISRLHLCQIRSGFIPAHLNGFLTIGLDAGVTRTPVFGVRGSSNG
jgi:hypothetical protein